MFFMFCHLFIVMPPRIFEYRPGWIAFVEGECTDQEFANVNRDIIEIMQKEMYPFEYLNINYYYHLGFDRFAWNVTRQIQERKRQDDQFDRPNYLRPILVYFYNRQLIVQMTYIPKMYPGQEISIPLQKSPAMEIQIDTMHFLPAQQDRIGNRRTLGLVVILEPFSRFMWIYPYGKIQNLDERIRENIGAAAAFQAFQQAFQSNGPDGLQFYTYLRDKIKRIVTDNGSEFQGDFARRYKEVFPNAQLYYATAKANTFGRPTNTGPVEIAIGTLRRALRDYEVAIEKKFFADQGDLMKNLRQVVYSYNNTIQLQTLRSEKSFQPPSGRKRRHVGTPQHVAQYTINNSPPLEDISQYMTSKRNKKIEKYLAKVNEYEIDAENPLRNGTYVRLYYPPPALSKLVRFRVSFELYQVQRIYPANNAMVAELRDVDSGEIKRDIGLKRLVLVKKPDPSPQSIREGLRHVMREQLQQQQQVQRANQQHNVIPNNPAVNRAVMGQGQNQNLPLQPGPLPRGRGAPAGGPAPPPRRGDRDRRQNQMLQGYALGQNGRGGDRNG